MKRKRVETKYEQKRIEEIRPRKKRNLEIIGVGKVMELENEEVRNRITSAEETMTLKKKLKPMKGKKYLVILWKYGEVLVEEEKFKAEKFVV
jgi:hypothetical protein